MKAIKLTKLTVIGIIFGIGLGTALAQPGSGSWTICRDECNYNNVCPNGYGGLAAERQVCYVADNNVEKCREGRWNIYYCQWNWENQGVGDGYVYQEFIGSYCNPGTGAMCNGGA